MRIGLVARRKMDRPRQSAFTTVATAIQEATDAPEDRAYGDARSDDIRQFPQGQRVFSGIKNAGQRGANQAPVINQSASPNHEDFGNRLARELFVPIRDNVES